MLKDKGAVRYLERTGKAKTIEALIADFLGKPIVGLAILDIGCGNGQITEYLSGKNLCTGVDIDDHRSKKNSKFEFELVENEYLPFKDSSFDIVISHHVIEHVSEQSQTNVEIYRVLKNMGIAYLACPNRDSPFMKGHVGNKKVPTLKRIESLLKETQFESIEYYSEFLSRPKAFYNTFWIGEILPKYLLLLLRRWFPSHCYMLMKV